MFRSSAAIDVRQLSSHVVRSRDQLWTNDGQYKVPAPGQEFPLDLAVSSIVIFYHRRSADMTATRSYRVTLSLTLAG